MHDRNRGVAFAIFFTPAKVPRRKCHAQSPPEGVWGTGVQFGNFRFISLVSWIPACAGMTDSGAITQLLNRVRHSQLRPFCWSWYEEIPW
jgi:hypothetical protein